VSSNEPIGPQSSVAEDADPLRLTMSYATVFVAKNSAYVLHTGAGIRGGGAADQARGRAVNFWEVPNWGPILAGLQAARRYLPAGLANWDRHNAHWRSAPITGYQAYIDGKGLNRAYAATCDGQIVQLLLGVTRPVTGIASNAMALDVRHPLTGAVIAHHDLIGGQAFTVEGLEGFIVTGAFR
jgi:hypothetical protein